MNVYVLGAYRNRSFGDDCYTAVLKEKFVTVWPNYDVHFHRLGDTHFCPDETDELIIGGGITNLEFWLRYPAALQLFDRRSAMLGAGLQDEPGGADIIDAMALRTVRDPESAGMLRAAGVTSSICVCADLAYLLPWAKAEPIRKTAGKPVLGVFASNIAGALQDLGDDFEIRPIVYDPEQPNAIEKFRNDFRQSDICITTHLHGVILSVLENIPFVAIGTPGEKVQRECSALDYPLFVAYERGAPAVRDAWLERSTLKESLSMARPQRIRLAERNMELLRAMPPWDSDRRNSSPEANRLTLVIWAAGDEFWDEAGNRLNALGSFDCLMPANSNLRPTNARRRIALPPGTLMHWAMIPAEIRNAIERRYENVVFCHTHSSGAASRLSDLASRSGSRVWEYSLWTDSFNVAAHSTGPAAG